MDEQFSRMPRNPTKEECLIVAGRVLGRAVQRIMSSTPREAAEAAYKPGGPSVDELEVQIREYQNKYRATE